MASRRESRTAATGLNTLQEFENRANPLYLSCLTRLHGLTPPPNSAKNLQGLERQTRQVRLFP